MRLISYFKRFWFTLFIWSSSVVSSIVHALENDVFASRPKLLALLFWQFFLLPMVIGSVYVHFFRNPKTGN